MNNDGAFKIEQKIEQRKRYFNQSEKTIHALLKVANETHNPTLFSLVEILNNQAKITDTLYEEIITLHRQSLEEAPLELHDY